MFELLKTGIICGSSLLGLLALLVAIPGSRLRSVLYPVVEWFRHHHRQQRSIR